MLFVYNASTFEELPQDTRLSFNKEWGRGQGWGVTDDGDHTLFLSDGSRSIFEMDARTMKVTRQRQLNCSAGPALFCGSGEINELEWVPLPPRGGATTAEERGRERSTVYFNVWNSDMIGHYDVEQGCVLRWIDLTGLLATSAKRCCTGRENVLNGIAWHDGLPPDTLLLTGKLWPALFLVQLTPPK